MLWSLWLAAYGFRVELPLLSILTSRHLFWQTLNAKTLRPALNGFPTVGTSGSRIQALCFGSSGACRVFKAGESRFTAWCFRFGFCCKATPSNSHAVTTALAQLDTRKSVLSTKTGASLVGWDFGAWSSIANSEDLCVLGTDPSLHQQSPTLSPGSKPQVKGFHSRLPLLSS